MSLEILDMPLLTEKYTQVLFDKESVCFDAPHRFVVVEKEKDEQRTLLLIKKKLGLL